MPPKTKSKEETESIYTIYFDLFQKYQSEYGNNIVVLLQVGAFFEIYGLRLSNGEIIFSNIEEISQITQLAVADKGIEFARICPTTDKTKKQKGKIVMAGFRDHRLDFYVQRFTEAGMTAVVYVQKKDGRAVSRELYQIYSPGSFISYESESQTTFSNHTMCIWFDSYLPIRSQEKHIVYGLSTVNIFTGETTMYESNCPLIMNPTTFDELDRYLSIIQPNEVIIISNFDKERTQLFLNYSGIKTQNIHHIYLKELTNKDIDSNKNVQSAINCTKQTYITHVLSTFFGEEAFQQCREFSEYTIATQAFCYLMHFIQAHNPDLVRKIEYPIFNNLSDRLCLANHTLKQLNIINDGSDDAKISGHLSSVLAFFNKCCTASGKRNLRTAITTPTFNESLLKIEYDMIERMLVIDTEESTTESKIDIFRKTLKKIRDIERISRQLIIKKIYPSTVSQLYESIGYVRDCFLELEKYPEIQQYLCDIQNSKLFDQNNMEILSFMDDNLNVTECASVNSMNSIDKNIIRPGISIILDGILREYTESCELFERIRGFFNGHMKKASTDSSINDDTEYIKIHETDKSGSSLQITKKRGLILKSVLEKVAVVSTEKYDKKDADKILEITQDFHIPLKDIRFIKATGTNDEIEFPQLTRILQKMNSLKERISSETSKEYLKFLERFERKYYNEIHSVGKYIGKLDVLLTKAYIAKTYKYCKPIIDNSQAKSFINVTGLRHPLIEHIQQNETYVTNDLIIGDGQPDGILIYGTNAVGKTSFIRAVGISVILAQAGFYVPCSTFIYKPYTAIFSRILGNDNIFKGLSTFAVEMSELRVILRLADENSLILGDELCSGTETESALSIFTTGLMELHEKQSTFLFATHFHEICKYDEIQDLDRMRLTHMSVHYDSQLDALVYDRLLKPGSGTRMYGLEVCKSLYLGNEFLEKAYAIRNKYYKTGELSFGTSHFNQKKVVGFCEICKSELAKEVHHLSPQRDADKKGFIQTKDGKFHKNHKANLASVCSTCHDKIHSDEKYNDDKMTKKKKTTKGYILENL
jgi:DNA mismatch repair protein MutS